MSPITNGMKLSQVRDILNETIAAVNELTSAKTESDEDIAKLDAKCAGISTALDALAKRVEALESKAGKQ